MLLAGEGLRPHTWASPGAAGVLATRPLASLRACAPGQRWQPELCMWSPHLGNHASPFPQFLTGYAIQSNRGMNNRWRESCGHLGTWSSDGEISFQFTKYIFCVYSQLLDHLPGSKDVTKSRIYWTDIYQFISHSDSTCLHMNQLESVYFKIFTDVLLFAGYHSVTYQKCCGNWNGQSKALMMLIIEAERL